MDNEPKRGAPSGNRNAAKGEENATANLHIRVSPREKNAYVRATQARTKRDPSATTKLADWARDTLNAAAQKELGES